MKIEVNDRFLKACGAFFTDDELCFIRDEFACIMEKSNNANDELDIINRCCFFLGDPFYDSYQDFLDNNNGSWSVKNDKSVDDDFDLDDFDDDEHNQYLAYISSL